MAEKTTKFSKEDHEALHLFLKKHAFSSHLFTKTTNFLVSFDKGEVSQSKRHEFLWPRLQKGENLQEVQKEREELQEKLSVFKHFSARTNVDVGDLCENMHEVAKVFGDEEKFSIEFKEGQVLLIDFWATW